MYSNIALKFFYEGRSRENVGQMKYCGQINPIVKYVQTKLSSKRLRAVNLYLMTFFFLASYAVFQTFRFSLPKKYSLIYNVFSKKKNAWCNQHSYQADKQKYRECTNHNKIRGTGFVSGKSLFWWCHDL